MKREIIVFSNFFLPGVLGGGPIRSLEGQVKKLAKIYNFHIITASHDAFSSKDYDSVDLDRWNNLEYASCYYLSDKKKSIKIISKIIKDKKNNFDIIYINSFFNFWYSILPLIIYKFFYSNKKFSFIN